MPDQKETPSIEQLASVVKELVKLQATQLQKTGEDTTSLGDLAKLLMHKEKREAEKDAAEQQRLKAIDEQYSRNARGANEKDAKDWSRCQHLKGGRMAHRMPVKRTAVYLHIYPDGEPSIRCGVCGMKWKERDTEQYLYINRKFRPNPTGIGWAGALQLLSNTDNSRSTSEVNPVVAADLRELRKKQFEEDMARFNVDPNSMIVTV